MLLGERQLIFFVRLPFRAEGYIQLELEVYCFITAINTKPQSKESNAVKPYEFTLRLIIFHFFRVQDR